MLNTLISRPLDLVDKVARWLRVKDNRAHVYQDLTVLGGVCVGAHLFTGGQLQTVLTDAGLLLGLGSPALSAIHTPTKATKARRARKANQ